MSPRKQALGLALILIVAAYFRLSGLDWDDYRHYHPDERYIAWVATTIEWPDDLSVALESQHSTLNPFYWPPGAASEGILVPQDEIRRFAYGHVPLYLGVLFTRLTEWAGDWLGPMLPQDWPLTRDILNGADRIEFHHLTVATRALTALVDVGTVALLFFLGRRLYDPLVGLLAAAFLALTVLHIQLAHFFTSDPYLTFFVLAAVLAMVLAVQQQQQSRRRYLWLLLAAVFSGLAVGSKFSAILLLLPLALAALSDGGSRRRRLIEMGLAMAAAVGAFMLSNPFAWLALHCPAETPPLSWWFISIPSLEWRSCYLQNIVLQGTMVRGSRDVAFVRQYAGTWPFLYYIEMQLRWGMGPLLGLTAFSGFGWAIGRYLYRHGRDLLARWRRPWPVLGREPALLIVLAWTIPFFLSTGNLFVKFMRYMQPLVPFLLLFGAAMLLQWRSRRSRLLLTGLVLVSSLVYALAFTNLYRQEHPWVAASRWIFEEIPAESAVVIEFWDDPLPDNIIVDGTLRLRSEYQILEVNWLSGTEAQDSPAKLANNLEQLAAADYLVIASNRNYGVVPRLPERYPLSAQYYLLLFSGQLGYDAIYAGTRMPELAGLHLKWDPFSWPDLPPPEYVADYLSGISGLNGGRFDESFTVYDQPLVIIFANRDRLSAEAMAALFANP